ncbi:MAG: hypothetical protein CSB19_00555 [Clostridiales bacterium]|nr:MAG: hypothetical protein CSB19_00555 [Clostridiales bacterium]
MEYIDFKAYQFGYNYGKASTTFTVFATDCEQLSVAIYADANRFQYTLHAMREVATNVWSVEIPGDLDGTYYNYFIDRSGLRFKANDPFAFSCSTNGRRSCVVDLARFKQRSADLKHVSEGLKSAIIYETHIRDFTVKTGDSVVDKGKYLGVIEGTGEDDRLSYLKHLGVSHIHFLPLQDFSSVDETVEDDYNWGYDPHHYFIPEGAYATDVDDPYARIDELLQMVEGVHGAGLGLILDVVYNHTYDSAWQALEILAPSVYFRKWQDGTFSDGSGCGSELNTMHPATRYLIVESLKHWQNFYGFDGFRFDLMALIDTETMQFVAAELKKTHPDVILYGEPWVATSTSLDPELRFVKGKQRGSGIAVFNDDYRQLLKGDSDGGGVGFVQGDSAQSHFIKTHLLGAIDYSEEHKGFTDCPFEAINYISAHDNLILYDKLKLSTNWSDREIMRATKLSFALFLLAFGVPFIQGGTELMHSKKMDRNSYKSGDRINAIDWSKRAEFAKLTDWVAKLTAFRKAMPCYHSFDAAQIRNHVKLLNHETVIGFQIEQVDFTAPYTMILINGQLSEQVIDLSIDDSLHKVLSSYENSCDHSRGFVLQEQQVCVLQQQTPFLVGS